MKKIKFAKRDIAEIEFENKINLFALITIVALILFLFTFFIMLHQSDKVGVCEAELYNMNQLCNSYNNEHSPKILDVNCSIIRGG